MTDSIMLKVSSRHHSISDMAKELNIPSYRLRLWEDIYPVFQSRRSEDGQRYYSENDIKIIRRIASLLYQEGRKSHEIVAILKDEYVSHRDRIGWREQQNREKGNLSSTVMGQRELEARLLSLAEENVALREEIEGGRKQRLITERQNDVMQRELSNALSILGQENARLLEETYHSEHSIQALEQEKIRLSAELKKLHERQEAISREGGVTPERMRILEQENETLQQEVETALSLEREALAKLREENTKLEAEIEKLEILQDQSLKQQEEIEKKCQDQIRQGRDVMRELQEAKNRLEGRLAGAEKAVEREQAKANRAEERLIELGREKASIRHEMETVATRERKVRQEKQDENIRLINKLKLLETEREKEQGLLREVQARAVALEQEKQSLQKDIEATMSRDGILNQTLRDENERLRTELQAVEEKCLKSRKIEEELRISIASAERRCDVYKVENQEARKHYENMLQMLEADKKRLKELIRDNEAERVSHLEVTQNLARLENEKVQLSEEKARLEEAFEKMKEEHKQETDSHADALLALEVQALELQEKLQAEELETARLKTQEERNLSKLKQFEEERKTFKGTLSDVETNLEEAREQRDRQKRHIDSEKKRFQEEIAQMRSVRDEATGRLSSLQEAHNVLKAEKEKLEEERKKETESHAHTVLELEVQILELQEKLQAEELERVHQKAQDDKNREKNQTQLQRLQSEKDSLNREIDALQEKIETLQKDIKQAEALNESAALARQLAAQNAQEFSLEQQAEAQRLCQGLREVLSGLQGFRA